MATVIVNNNMLEVSLTPDERETCEGLPEGKLGAYLTLWLQEQQRQLVGERFSSLTPQEKADALAIIKKQGRGGRPL